MNETVALSADVVFRDALGERHRLVDSTGGEAELLSLSAELTAVPAFEPALLKSISRLADFRHPSFAAVRSAERLNATTLGVMSDSAHGVRLSRLLANTAGPGTAIDFGAALCLLRQLLGGIEALHAHDRDIAHGALGPERIVINARARVIITDHALGAGLEQLRYSHQHYWKSLRIAVPRSTGLTRFDHRVDLMQIGTIALALILGRALKDDEYSAKLVDLVNSARVPGSGSDLEPLRPALRAWLLRSMQFDPHHSFTSASEAGVMLDNVMSDDDRVAGMASLERVLMRHHGVAPVAPDVQAAPAEIVARETPPPETIAPAAAVSVPEVVQTAPVPTPTPMRMPAAARWPRVAVAAAVVAAITAGALFAVRRRASASTLAPGTGTLVMQSSPSGARVDIDGTSAGVTPLTLTLPAGLHAVVLRCAGEPRRMQISVAAGSQITQYIELPKSVTTTGGLLVRTEPPGALVTVDHAPQGASPATITGLAPGDHTVVVSSDGVSVEQIVNVDAGVTSSLVVPLASRDRALLSGWVSVSAPIDVQIFENGKLLGSNQTDRLMVSAGEHHLEFVNDAFGYRVSRTVPVGPGKVESIALKMPMGSVSVNAVPWAEVWLDGEKAGDTPIGNLQAAIGRHEVVFRHPELGESRQAVTVTLSAPARLSVDMRKK